jgi:hypothetical protein
LAESDYKNHRNTVDGRDFIDFRAIKQSNNQKVQQTNKQSNNQKVKQTNKHKNKQTNIQTTEKEPNKQTNKRIENKSIFVNFATRRVVVNLHQLFSFTGPILFQISSKNKQNTTNLLVMLYLIRIRK